MNATLITLIFTIALFSGSVGTPIVRKIAIKAGFIAIPKADRAHTEATALMGGVAIYGAAIIALALVTIGARLVVGDAFRLGEVGAIVAGASLMALVGYLDDRYNFSPKLKLALEFLPVVVVFGFGVQIQLHLLPDPLWNNSLNFILTAMWIVFMTNALNYMDNADGVAIMTTVAASAIFLLIALQNEQQLVSILAAAILGASLGFARYNLPLPKSTIFMGDSGSLFLGFLLAVLAIKIRIPSNTPAVTWMVPVIVLGMPIFDTGLVYISRKRRGVSFLTGGVDHTTHRLARLGADKLSVALIMSIATGGLGLAAIFITQLDKFGAYLILLALVATGVYALKRLEFSASYFLRTGKRDDD